MPIAASPANRAPALLPRNSPSDFGRQRPYGGSPACLQASADILEKVFGRFSQIVSTHVPFHFFQSLPLSFLLFASPRARGTTLRHSKLVPRSNLLTKYIFPAILSYEVPAPTPLLYSGAHRTV